MTIQEQIAQWKQKRDAVILAHYYTEAAVQDIADYVGDSYYLAKIANQAAQKTIVLCGVYFMGESAKILNPDKTVLVPDAAADCPMAHMITVEEIQSYRARFSDLAVVCYINSTAELKTYADVCVTSANAKKVVEALPNQNILFIPDQNLGRYLAEQLPQKHFIFHDGYCPVHQKMEPQLVKEAKAAHPEAVVLAHPECIPDTLQYADIIGSTSELIGAVHTCDAKEFIVATEEGVWHPMQNAQPDKRFYPVMQEQVCAGMKLITLPKILEALRTLQPEVMLEEAVRQRAAHSLQTMLELAQS